MSYTVKRVFQHQEIPSIKEQKAFHHESRIFLECQTILVPLVVENIIPSLLNGALKRYLESL